MPSETGSIGVERKRALRAYVDYLRDMGVYDLYRRSDAVYEDAPFDVAATTLPAHDLPIGPLAQKRPPDAQRVLQTVHAVVDDAALRPRGASGIAPASSADQRESALPTTTAARHVPSSETAAQESPISGQGAAIPVGFDNLAPLPAVRVAPAQKAAALHVVQEDIGDCTRCPLAYAGRHKIVFGDGDPNAELMFVGEGPGADEDMQGLPFVGKGGQLLNNMIAAMGLKREQVYIANIVKCRPPNNRVPEPVEANTCTQFLLRQMDIVQPKVVVALGATAATYLLGRKTSLSSLRGRWHTVRGAKLAVTYHPAFLLRDPRQKGEAWKDLQMVMAELGLKPATKN